MYAEVFGPGALGAGLRFRQGRVLVVEVVDQSPAALAGLLPGDEIAAVNGLNTPTLLQWRLVGQNFEVGRPVTFDVRRGEERLSLQATLGPHWKRFGFGTWLTLAAKLLAQLVTLGLGILIALRRPRDLVAVIGRASSSRSPSPTSCRSQRSTHTHPARRTARWPSGTGFPFG